MSNRQTREINILNACRPYLRLLQAYNSENFCHNNWRDILHSAFYVFSITITILLIPLLFILSVWHLIEKGSDMKTSVVITPLCVTLVHTGVTSITLIVNNRAITKILSQIQKIVDQSKFSNPFFEAKNQAFVYSIQQDARR